MSPQERALRLRDRPRVARQDVNEIANNGYAGRLELILYPFEERWFNSTREASQKWERRLKEKTATSLRGLPAFSKLKTSGVSLWMDQIEERVKAAIIDPRDKAIEEKELPVFEEIEARAIAALQKRSLKGEPIIRPSRLSSYSSKRTAHTLLATSGQGYRSR